MAGVLFPKINIAPAILKTLKNRTLSIFAKMLACVALSCPGWACQAPEARNYDESDYHFGIKNDGHPPSTLLPQQPDSVLQTAHFQFFAHGLLDTAPIMRHAEKCEAIFDSVSAFTGVSPSLPRVNYHLYRSIEEKGLMLQNTQPSQFDAENWEVHTVLNDIYSENPCGKEGQLLLRKLLGEAATPILECGLALHFSKDWQKKGYKYWAAKLYKGGGLLPLQDLFDASFWEKSSEIILGCQTAVFVDFLLQQWGRQAFLKNYPTWKPSQADLDNIGPLWAAFLEQQFGEPQAETSSHRPEQAPLPYLKGFNFAHEGYRMHNGYGSQKADDALLEMKESLFVNAVAIVPYSFLKNPNTAVPIPVVKRSGTETDEAVVHTCVSSKKLGLTVMLKPQLWLGGGSWPGDIAMPSDEDWDTFFKFYKHWILHYAMLAEIYDLDVLCLGTEMVKTTAAREKDWRELIRSVRQVYRGQLTYAANWGEEFENIQLWDELDFIGLNCYYPLSAKDNPSDRELENAFEGILKKAKKKSEAYGKPLIFTEIGFASVQAPWKKPHEDWGELTYNAEHQKRCYEIVFKCLENQAWCQGILWWKFPSDMYGHRRRETTFSPFGKPAAEVVRQWFGKM
jgi:hypothetical protein